jgi:hypothetical protein
MKRIQPPLLWLAIALIGMALAAASFIMVAWLKLQPYPLCIAQRTLFMLMGGVAHWSPSSRIVIRGAGPTLFSTFEPGPFDSHSGLRPPKSERAVPIPKGRRLACAWRWFRPPLHRQPPDRLFRTCGRKQ